MFPFFQFPGQLGGMPGNSDLHGSPQAVFTSFKLPKPGGGPENSSNNPLSPVTTTTTVTQSGFGSRLFPMGLGNLPQPSSANNSLNSPPKVSAPLGGLPALADQILMQQQRESNNNRNNDDQDSASPPGTPPPAKRKPDGGDSSSEGTPPKNQGLIKAKGTYYPLTAFPTNMPQGPVMRRGESPPRSDAVTSGKTHFITVTGGSSAINHYII